MRHCLNRAVAALVLTVVLASTASAADVRLAESPQDGAQLGGVVIEGPIEPGDFVKFASLVLAVRGANVVWLASPGGNLSESLRIGRLIRQLALEVRAPIDRARPLVRLRDAGNNTCSSACFFLYAAGVHRQGTVLGIHKAALPADEYFKLGLDGAAAAHQQIEEAIAAYLEVMGVPAHYASAMRTASSVEMIWLSNEDIAKDLSGFAPGHEHLSTVRLAEIQEDRRQRTRRQLLGNE